MLIVELDGGQHSVAIEKDAARTVALEAAGYTVIRFWNNDVIANTNGVLEDIRLALLNARGGITSLSSGRGLRRLMSVAN